MSEKIPSKPISRPATDKDTVVLDLSPWTEPKRRAAERKDTRSKWDEVRAKVKERFGGTTASAETTTAIPTEETEPEPKIKRAGELLRDIGAEKDKAAFAAAQDAYVANFNDFYAKNSLFNRIKSSIIRDTATKKSKESLATDEKAYAEARLAYANKLTESARARLDTPERTAKLRAEYEAKYNTFLFARGTPTFEKFKQAEIDKIVERYNGIVRYREIAKPTLEKKNAARLNALATKEKGVLQIFGKGVSWGLGKIAGGIKSVDNVFKKGIQKVTGDRLSEKHAETAARAARLLATTIVFTGAGVATGGIGLAAAGIYVGQRAARIGVSVFGGAAAGAGAGTAYEKTLGKKAKDTSKKTRRGTLTSTKDLDVLDRAQSSGSAEAVANKKRLIETAAAAALSFGFTVEQVHAAMQHPAVAKAAEHVAKATEQAHEAPKPLPKVPEKHEQTPPLRASSGNHERYSHHPHAAAGQEDPDRSAQIREIYKKEIGHGIDPNDPLLHGPEDTASASGTKNLSTVNSSLDNFKPVPPLVFEPEHPSVHTPPEAQDHIKAPEDEGKLSPDTGTIDGIDKPAPQQHVASTEKLSDAAPALQTEVPSSPIEAITKSELFAKVQNASALDALELVPLDSTSAPALFREELFTLVRESGTGPVEDETIKDYIQRAAKVMSDYVTSGKKSFDIHPAIYKTADHLQVHGGDFNARQLVASEYIDKNPGAIVDVENPDGEVKLIEFSARGIANGEYPPATAKLVTITESDKPIF